MSLLSRLSKCRNPSCVGGVNVFAIPIIIGFLLIFFGVLMSIRLEYFDNIVYSEAIHNSHSLRFTAGCVLSCAFPMIVDILLDIVSNTSTIDCFERLLVLCSVVTPSTALLVNGEHFVPMIYVALQLLQAIVVAAIVYSVVHRVSKDTTTFFLLLGSIWWNVLTATLQIYTLLRVNSGSILREVSTASTIVSVLLLLAIQWNWFSSLYKKAIDFGSRCECIFSDDEVVCSMYLIIYGAYLVIAVILSLATPRGTSAATMFIILSTLQILFCVPVMLIPNRLARTTVVQTAMALLELKRTFVRYVSHEIRSPMNVSLAGLEMVKSEIIGTNASKSLVELIGEIYEANEIAITILSDLLHYESLDAGTFHPEMKLKRLVRMFYSKLSFCNLLARKKNIELSIQDCVNCMGQGFYRDRGQNHRLDASRFVVNIDIPRILQVLRNLVTNAVKFTPSGGKMVIRMTIVEREIIEVNAGSKHPTFFSKNMRSKKTSNTRKHSVAPFPQVEMSNMNPEQHSRALARVQEGSFGGDGEERDVDPVHQWTGDEKVHWLLRIEVTDSGAGIAKENHGKVFGEFSQFNRNKLQDGGGSGLGLWVCRKIVQMHCGVLDFTSEGEGMGSTFFIEIPILKRSASFEMSELQGEIEKSASTRNRSGGRLAPLIDQVLEGLNVVDGSSDHKASLRSQSSNPLPLQSPSPQEDDDETVLHEPRGELESAAHSMKSNGLRSPGEVSENQGDDAQPPKESFRPVRFLVVDDSAMNRKIIKRMIESETSLMPNVVIIEADDGSTAVEAMKADIAAGDVFDCVLMDFVMSKMHGPEAAASMRSQIGFKGAIIAVTGNVMPQEYRVFLDSGADDVLAKPLTKAKMLRLLADLRVFSKSYLSN